ncbi:MAG: sulfite oxidase [Acidobacteriota bacterium]|nr:sulfite oxidase [Acidobacteriota bacterium]
MGHFIARRTLLRSASVGAFSCLAPSFGQNATPGRPPAPAPNTGLIIREKEPENLESPASVLRTFITPADQFYIRNHFKQPEITADAWGLKVQGAVGRPLEIGYRDLVGMPPRTQVSMLECAGNGRVFLVPKENGAQWQSGGMGNAEWTGVPLGAILEKAGLKSNAVDVMFEGADQGEIKDDPKSPGEIHFARSLPVAKARNGNVLLAYKMNGADLSPAHGFPVRVIVPGWYGMASVKWLARIVVTDKPFDGFFQSLQYSHWERPNGTPTLLPVTEMHVKASIVTPMLDEVVPRDAPFKVRGLAWAGESGIAQVEVSTNGGQNWSKAVLTGPTVRYAWRLWEYDWQAPTPGHYTLMARGTDTEGHIQPMERNKDHRNYEITHVLPVKVEVR